MTPFRYLFGTVYIFENCEARRVKVGMTINNAVDRLNDVNDMWLQRKITCQICGGHLVGIMGLVPQHVVSGKDCAGGNSLPLEKEVELAISYQNSIKNCLHNLTGSEKGSATRIVKTLEKRIAKYKNYTQPTGRWEHKISFHTKCAEQVELLSHEILMEYLDNQAPFGEVFSCTVLTATEAIEKALSQLGLLDLAKKETQ